VLAKSKEDIAWTSGPLATRSLHLGQYPGIGKWLLFEGIE